MVESILFWSLAIIVACVALFNIIAVGYMLVALVISIVEEIQWRRECKKKGDTND